MPQRNWIFVSILLILVKLNHSVKSYVYLRTSILVPLPNFKLFIPIENLKWKSPIGEYELRIGVFRIGNWGFRI